MTREQRILVLIGFGLVVQILGISLIGWFLGIGPAIAIFVWTWGNNIQVYVKMLTEFKNDKG